MRTLILISLLMVSVVQAQPATYTVTDLGSFFPASLSDDGWLAGSMITTAGQIPAQGTVAAIQALSHQGRINRVCGQEAVGYSGSFGPGDINQQLSAWDRGGALTQHGLLPGGLASAGTGCTEDGLISFYADTADLVIRAGYRDAAGMHVLLPTLDGDSYAADINNAHQLLVDAEFANDGLQRSYLCDTSGGCTQLVPEGTALSVSTQLTDNGWASGTAYRLEPPAGSTPYRWSAAKGYEPLTTPDGLAWCASFGINRMGAVVGGCEVVGTPMQARALWCSKPSSCVDVNTVLAEPDGWIIESCAAINRWSELACSGTLAGVRRGALLTPVKLAKMRDRVGRR